MVAAAAAVEAGGGAAQSPLKISGSWSDLKQNNRCRPLCQVSSASMVALSATLILGLLTPLAIAFPPMDRDVNDQGFLTEDNGVVREGSRRLQFHFDSQGRATGRVLGAEAGGYLRRSQPKSADFDEKTVGIGHDEKGGTLRDGRDRCFVDEDSYQRCYPTVFFFGTSKCATTSLARWLDAHPATHWVANPRRPHQIEETGVKEAHVFDDPPKDDHVEEQIFLHEKLLITSPKVNPEDVVIDYTPHYLASSEAAHRIARMYGKGSGLKFIVTLREPASRAISSWEFKNEYNPKRGRREERRTLEKTVRDGIKRGTKLLACIEQAKEKNLSSRKRDLIQCNPRKFLEMPLFVSHVGKSMYAVQLERWFNLFGRENFKVVFMDDMAVDPMGVLQDVLDFLGLDFTQEDGSKGIPTLDHWEKITGMSYNKTKSKKKDELANQAVQIVYSTGAGAKGIAFSSATTTACCALVHGSRYETPQVTDELKAELRRFFEPQNRELEKLLGCPVPPSWNQ